MNTLPIILSVSIAFAATLSAGLFIKKFKSNIGIICALASGFFIALALFDLLPEILALASENQISLIAILLSGTFGFVFLFAIERVFSFFQVKKHSMAKMSLQPRIGLLATLEFCSHGFLEGIAIGLSFQLQFGLGIVVAIAVISHDFCDGISTLTLMLNSGNSLKSSLGLLFVAASAPIIGTAVTLFVSIQESFLIFSLSFLVGTFFYIGGGTLLPDAYRMNRPIVTFGLFLIGFFLIVFLSKIIT
jgi:zinc transporter ZupT